MVFVEIIEVYYCNLNFYNVVYTKLAVFDTLVYKCTLAMETACMWLTFKVCTKLCEKYNIIYTR